MAAPSPTTPATGTKTTKPSTGSTPAAGIKPEDVIRRVGDTNERALAYVLEPDPQLNRLSRKVREAIITDLPPITAGALLGPAALARHFVASAASGRYRDLFPLWQLFRLRPDDCRPVLAERQRALEKGRLALTTAVRLGLSGHAERVAEDVTRAEGLIWQWLREALLAELPAVGQRPVIASALLAREPALDVPLPAEPDDRWLAEAAAARGGAPLAPPVEALLGANAHRLPATISTLSLAWEHYPERVAELVSRIDLESPSIGALLAWARDHALGDRVAARIREDVDRAAVSSRADGLAAWYGWRQRGVDVELPAALRAHSLDDLDISRPDTAALAAELIADGSPFDMQGIVADLATRNRQLAEKAYEAFVCAGLDVTLPATLQDNPLVKEGTRCPWCASWTYVRAGHERRCPRRPEPSAAPVAAVAEEAAPAAPPPAAPPAEAWDAALAEAEALDAAQAQASPAPMAPPAPEPPANAAADGPRAAEPAADAAPSDPAAEAGLPSPAGEADADEVAPPAPADDGPGPVRVDPPEQHDQDVPPA